MFNQNARWTQEFATQPFGQHMLLRYKTITKPNTWARLPSIKAVAHNGRTQLTESVMWNFGVLFVVRLKKLLNKQLNCQASFIMKY